MPLNVRPPEDLPFLAPHFVNYVKQTVSRWDHGYINTTLNSVQQRTLEKGISHYVSSNASSGINNAAALLLNYETMEIKAMVGSADFFNNALQGQVNGTLAKRSPGSALKPFVYALAMDEGLIHPMTLLRDSPKRFGGFSPENYDKQFLGPISARDALIQSRNVPAVDLQSQLTQTSFYDFLVDAGISGLKDEAHYGLALALGGGEVTMKELASLYAMLANKGVLKPIKSIKGTSDKTSKQLLSAEASFMILDILKDNPPPNALNFNKNSLQKKQVAWKTGTSWAFRDAWAVGVSGPYVLVVWVGNFDGTGNNAFIGRSAAGPLLFSFFSTIVTDKHWKVEDLTATGMLNIKRLKVCKNTGDLAEKHCPSTVSSWFIPGVSPIKVSNIYRSIPIEKSTGLRACWFDAEKTKMKTFEFWPSDFLQLFTQAGISLKTPPQYSKNCSLDQKSRSGQIPVITSPQTSIEYVIQSQEQGNNATREIPFSAIVDPNVETLYWFVNATYVGSSKIGNPFIWNASNGQYNVRVVDDFGRGASRKIKVLQIY
ncbi:MAG: penicillin-binding protein 1C [Pseudomonadales bacterium]|nr:penicillin-binding protein 1C [Pseudomonadales bacterium]